ncbi:MAG: thiamine biosynthesis protein ThiS [Candidatus Adiutrix intracellularis]|jgi:molybdopterin converting factor small subunit|nr:MAG: thiamine biosynthesis protein ThiS [Candidatus Adiutrix intracellularis]MDR2827694.1 MoaD/ThiS family protein [Candidatus Adiutrix intracellularis]
MLIQVRLSAFLRAAVPGYQPDQGVILELAGPATAADLAVRLDLPLEQIKLTLINGRRVSLESPVVDGDQLGFFPALGGG